MGNRICMPCCTARERNCQHQSDTCRVLALSEEDRKIVSNDIEERTPAWNTADMDTECNSLLECKSEKIADASHSDSLEVLDRSEEDEPMASIDLEGRLPASSRIDMDMECTICMEPISEETILPCQCKLHYCLSCWDKALANSFSQRGQPTCPSCRTLVRADFDAENNCLVFSTEAIDMTFAAQRELAEKLRHELESQKPGASLSAEEIHKFLLEHDEFQMLIKAREMRQGTIERLRHQASPVQVKLLQHYGKTNPSLLEVHGNAREVLQNSSISELETFLQEAGVDRSGCLEKSDLVNQLVENSHSSRISSLWASQQCSPPKCVCGCSFSLVSGLDRFKMMIPKDDRDSLPDEAIELAFQQRADLAAALVVCDICESSVPLARNSHVWTCENRTSSILHATSYDICETCFVQSACVR